MGFETKKTAAMTILGIRRTTPYGGGTWGLVKSDGSLEKMQEIAKGPVELGLCFGFEESGANDYMVGFPYQGEPLPEYDRFDYPETTWLLFSAKGAISAGVLGETWQKIYETLLPESGYTQAPLPTIERYILWNEAADQCEVMIHIPINEDCAQEK